MQESQVPKFDPLKQARIDANPDPLLYAGWVGAPGEVNPAAARDFADYLESRPYMDGLDVPRDPKTGKEVDYDADYHHVSRGGLINERIESETLGSTPVDLESDFESMHEVRLAREIGKAEAKGQAAKVTYLEELLTNKVMDFARSVKTERNNDGLPIDSVDAIFTRLAKISRTEAEKHSKPAEKSALVGMAIELVREETKEVKEVITPEPVEEGAPIVDIAEPFAEEVEEIKADETDPWLKLMHSEGAKKAFAEAGEEGYLDFIERNKPELEVFNIPFFLRSVEEREAELHEEVADPDHWEPFKPLEDLDIEDDDRAETNVPAFTFVGPVEEPLRPGEDEEVLEFPEIVEPSQAEPARVVDEGGVRVEGNIPRRKRVYRWLRNMHPLQTVVDTGASLFYSTQEFFNPEQKSGRRHRRVALAIGAVSVGGLTTYLAYKGFGGTENNPGN